MQIRLGLLSDQLGDPDWVARLDQYVEPPSLDPFTLGLRLGGFHSRYLTGGVFPAEPSDLAAGGAETGCEALTAAFTPREANQASRAGTASWRTAS